MIWRPLRRKSKFPSLIPSLFFFIAQLLILLLLASLAARLSALNTSALALDEQSTNASAARAAVDCSTGLTAGENQHSGLMFVTKAFH